MSEEQAEYTSQAPTPTAPTTGDGAIAETWGKELLPCKLTTHELLEKGLDLEAALARRDEIEWERKKAADAFKEQLDDQAGKIRELRKCIRTREEERAVTIRITLDYRRGQVIRTREDTGEILSERAMTATERQQEMPL